MDISPSPRTNVESVTRTLNIVNLGKLGQLRGIGGALLVVQQPYIFLILLLPFYPRLAILEPPSMKLARTLCSRCSSLIQKE